MAAAPAATKAIIMISEPEGVSILNYLFVI